MRHIDVCACDLRENDNRFCNLLEGTSSEIVGIDVNCLLYIVESRFNLWCGVICNIFDYHDRKIFS